VIDFGVAKQMSSDPKKAVGVDSDPIPRMIGQLY